MLKPSQGDQKIISFTLGPVQGFVAQARRTRDYWTGSFLLSYLAGVAMHQVIIGGGKIIFPRVQDDKGRVQDPLLCNIQAHARGGQVDPGVVTGSLPNRFLARAPGDFSPGDCASGVREAWQEIAGAVWAAYVQPVVDQGLGNGTRETWDRQIGGFWDMAWAAGEEEGEDLLERRKNWRTQVPTIEPGDKCTIMGNYQELSGHLRVQGHADQQRFWQGIRERVPALDLREDERLCAISLVKRLFPLVAGQAIGWPVPRNYPSSPYLSAAGWMREMIEDHPGSVEKFVALADQLPQAYKEYGTVIKSLARGAGGNKAFRKFISLDGNCFYAGTLENPRNWPARANAADQKKESGIRKKMAALLGQKDIPKPSPYYALLVMDGDNMGAILQESGDRRGDISGAISSFTREVPGVVEGRDGKLIFAGGEDVLALFPLEQALPAALELKTLYEKQFQGLDAGLKERLPGITISAGIVYAHHHAPLAMIYQKAHEILDLKAKEESGRASLAVSVWKTGGETFNWCMPWEELTKGEPDRITRLVQVFSSRDTGDTREGALSSSFIYNMQKRMDLFAGGGEGRPGEGGHTLEGIDLTALLSAEYLRGRGEVTGEGKPDHARQHKVQAARGLMEDLLAVCTRSYRDGEGRLHWGQLPFRLEGALLVKFLAGGGRES